MAKISSNLIIHLKNERKKEKEKKRDLPMIDGEDEYAHYNKGDP